MVRVQLTTSGRPRIVAMPIELYVAKVLAAEGQARAADAAQQALAIAIRTFAVANRGRHASQGFDLCDATHCQVLSASTPLSRRAVIDTAGQLLMFDGHPADVFYSASCGGKSESVAHVWRGATDLPYLRVADDDVHDSEVPWTLDLSTARVEQALRRAGIGGRLKDVEVEDRTSSGRVSRVRLVGMRPDYLAGDDFRAAIGTRELRSTSFTVTKIGTRLQFVGRGYGHGVGLCVIGAGLRAARGENVTQILAQYFPGLRLQATSGEAGGGVALPLEPDAPHRAPVTDPMAQRARDELASALGIKDPPLPVITTYETLDAYRQATGQPWWIPVTVSGTSLALAPIPVLESAGGSAAAIRRGIAEMLVHDALADRPAWVRVGAARYYASGAGHRGFDERVACPTDAELTLALSAAAQWEAERRAEACFARALSKSGDWRSVH